MSMDIHTTIPTHPYNDDDTDTSFGYIRYQRDWYIDMPYFAKREFEALWTDMGPHTACFPLAFCLATVRLRGFKVMLGCGSGMVSDCLPYRPCIHRTEQCANTLMPIYEGYSIMPIRRAKEVTHTSGRANTLMPIRVILHTPRSAHTRAD